MSKMFEATEIKGIKLANRFVRSATWEGMATEDGECTPALVNLMSRLVKGDVGLIITSYTYVRSDGQSRPWQLGIYKDAFIESFREMTCAVHDHDARIVLQINHGGFFADLNLTGQTPLAPTQLEDFDKTPHKEMTQKQIQEIVETFSQAAYRAKEAGFDGIQLHAAHGNLLSQFLSPFFNKRTDAYGGSVENRARALLEVLWRTRTVVGDDFPVLVKINSQDFLEGGLTLEDSMRVGTMLQEEGIDGIEVSGGTHISGKLTPSRVGITSEEKEAYFREAARVFKERLRVPIILVGGIRSFSVAERLVEEGYTDYVSMSRPFIREPNLVKRWASGDLRRAKCHSDNKCFGPAMAGEGIRCAVEKKQVEEN